MSKVKLRTFKVSNTLEDEIDRFANGPAAMFNLIASFGPLTKSDDSKHITLIFRAKDGEDVVGFGEG